MRFAGELAAVGTAVCWSAGSNLFAAAGRRMGSLTLNRLRITTAMLLLGLTLWIVRGLPWPVWATPTQVGLLAASGLVGFVFGDRHYFRSLVILGPGRATLVSSFAPVLTAVLAWPALGERPGPLTLLGMALTVGGVVWVLAEQEHRHHVTVEGSIAVGVFSGVLGALGQAGGFVLSKMALRTGLDALSATVIRAAAGAVAVWALALLQRQARETLESLRDRRAALFMVGGAFFGPYLGVTLSLTALMFIEADVAASIIAFYPVLTILIASRFHREPITWRLMLGALVAVAGVVVLFLR